MREKLKNYLTAVPQDVLLIVVLLLACILSFGLGYLAGKDDQKGSDVSLDASPLVSSSSTQQIVASRSGTKYYYPWCSGADRINAENKIYFDSTLKAEAQGYSPAANCKGL